MAVNPITGEVVIKRQPEILEEIIERQKELIDPNIENRNDEVLSELNQIFSELLSESNEFAEAVRDCWDIDRAEGFALDNLLALKKVRRIAASRSSTSTQRFVGENGLVIPSGRILRNVNTQDEFYTVGRTTLTSREAIASHFTVGTLEVGQDYTVNVDGYIITYTAMGGDTIADVMDGLSTEAATVLFDTDYVFSFLTPLPDSIIITTSFQDRDIDVLVSSNLVVNRVEKNTFIEAVEVGPILAPNFTIRELAVPISGLVETYNIGSLSVGRLTETDEEYRIRGQQASIVDGVGTIPAIEASLLSNVAGVTSAILVENDTSVTDLDGRPPKSYEVIVVGGEDSDIAEDLFRTKPAGIQTYGSETEIVLDQNGINRSISFTRPTAVTLDVRVTYSIYDEEIFPITGNAAIQEIVANYINGLGLNKDVIPTRIYGPIYSGVDGIDDLIVEIDDGGGFTEDRLPISQSQYASTTENDVTIVVV